MAITDGIESPVVLGVLWANSPYGDGSGMEFWQARFPDQWKIWNKAKSRQWVIFMENKSPLRAIIDPAQEFPTTSIVRGKTSLFARVERVGGVKPRVLLVFPDGDRRTFDVSTRALAKQISGKLYERAVLIGEAKWFSTTRKLAEFRVTDIGSYDERTADPGAALRSLSDSIGKYWNGVDADEYIREERAEG
jgi:hypothetical protein